MVAGKVRRASRKKRSRWFFIGAHQGIDRRGTCIFERKDTIFQASKIQGAAFQMSKFVYPAVVAGRGKRNTLPKNSISAGCHIIVPIYNNRYR